MEDEAGFRDFVRARLPRLSRAAYLLAGNHAQAEDLIQAALIKTAAYWSKVVRAGDPEAYVRKILYHEHIRTWRRRRFLEHPTASVPEKAASGDDTGRAELRMVLEQALAKLTKRQSTVGQPAERPHGLLGSGWIRGRIRAHQSAQPQTMYM
ncbi:sigma factor [Dactylosporangium sp. NPDC049742]|uniref:sigma factor n=1 Tax=Dactylosporangium sp. NPDC049742 TaxID=3154737 RepID=UPI003414AA06